MVVRLDFRMMMIQCTILVSGRAHEELTKWCDIQWCWLYLEALRSSQTVRRRVIG